MNQATPTATFIRKAKTFRRMPHRAKLLFLEAVGLSLFAYIALKWLPFKFVRRRLGIIGAEPNLDLQPDGEQLRLIQQIIAAIRLSHKYVLWNNVCYHQALVAKIMLTRRSVPTSVYFGFKRSAAGRIEGHAWTKSCGIVVTGQGELSEYAINAIYH